MKYRIYSALTRNNITVRFNLDAKLAETTLYEYVKDERKAEKKRETKSNLFSLKQTVLRT